MNTRLQSPPAARAATALVATLGLATAGWLISVPRMSGMDMGVATTLGSFPYFLSVWLPMMAAMMLPGTVPSALRMAESARSFGDVPCFVASYLGVWLLAGAAVYAVYCPHGTAVAGVIIIAAGLYEMSPVKGRFRRLCRDVPMPGWRLGLCCLGSSGGLMLVMVVLGVMSLTWMALLAGLLLVQKLVAPRAAIDVPIALAVLAVGLAQIL